MATAVSSRFATANEWHEKARPIVSAVFADRGFTVFDHGAEFAPGLSEEVRKQDDRCSLMLRFRPDMVTIRPYYRSLLCEIKSEPEGRDWQAYREALMEARSWKSLCEWNAGESNVAMLAYHSFNIGQSFGMWLSDLPKPQMVMVYRHGPECRRNVRCRKPEEDFAEQLEAMGKLLPGIERRVFDHKWGSGTPSIKVPKQYMVPLGEFIDCDVLGLCPRPTP